jgi:hypothetical protein
LLCSLKALLDHEHSKVDEEFFEKIRQFLLNSLEYKKEARVRLISGKKDLQSDLEIFNKIFCSKSV